MRSLVKIHNMYSTRNANIKKIKINVFSIKDSSLSQHFLSERVEEQQYIAHNILVSFIFIYSQIIKHTRRFIKIRYYKIHAY